MNTALATLLCQQWCKHADIQACGEGVRVSLPSFARDGDTHAIYLEPTLGGWRLSDKGAALMRLSYEHDLDHLLDGQRGKILGQVIAESGAQLDDGEVWLHSSEADLAASLMLLEQALTRIEDLALWTRLRIASTFYDDLYASVQGIAGADKVQRNWLIPELANTADYPIDMMISTARAPLFVFGVPSSDKARLVTIILQHLNAAQINYESLIVYQDMGNIPARDQRRLTNAANDLIDSIGATADLTRKIKHRLVA